MLRLYMLSHGHDVDKGSRLYVEDQTAYLAKLVTAIHIATDSGEQSVSCR